MAEILDQALELSPAERSAWVAKAAAGNAALAAEVEALLAAATAAGNFLETSIAEVAAELLADDTEGSGRIRNAPTWALPHLTRTLNS